ncbi:MAG: integrase core domain-containing protein [Acetobacteraceae bacterium]
MAGAASMETPRTANPRRSIRISVSPPEPRRHPCSASPQKSRENGSRLCASGIGRRPATSGDLRPLHPRSDKLCPAIGGVSPANAEARRRPSRPADRPLAATVFLLDLEARAGIAKWIAFYDDRRPHQALDYRTPMSVWQLGTPARPATRLWT